MTGTLTPDLDHVSRFIDTVWPAGAELPEHGSFVLWALAADGKKTTTWCPVPDRDRLTGLAVGLAGTPVNVYLGTALQDQAAAIEAAWAERRKKDGTSAPRPEPYHVRGTSETTLALSGLHIDLDVAGPAHSETDLPQSFDEAHGFVLDAVPLTPTLTVDTGHGIQAWWLFREPFVFGADGGRADAQALLRRWRQYVAELARVRGWRLDPTDDLARVLRVPGSFNVKLGVTGAPLARIVEYHPGRRWNPSDFELYLPADVPGKPTTPPKPRGSYAPVPVEPIVEKCAWLRHTRDDAARLPEPEWYAALTIVGRCENGPDLAHEWSRPHRGYTADETDHKLARAVSDTGPVTCSKVAAVTAGEWCNGCAYGRSIKSPVNLATPMADSSGPSTPKPEPPVETNGEPPRDEKTLPLPIRPLTETGNAERLLDKHGAELRWCNALGWLVWDGRRWARDERRQVYALAKLTVRRIYGEAEACDDDERRRAVVKWALKSETSGAREAMLSLVKSESGVAVTIEELDADPWLLNVRNGTLDLRTGKPHRHTGRDLITRLCPVEYRPDAVAPTWLAFLARVLPDATVREFMQRFIGYALTGAVREHVLPMLYGTGANGKSTLLEGVRYVTGDYAVQANPALLMAKTNDTHPTERATLLGRRLAICSETEEGRALAEVMVKQLTGGDRINARFMRMDEFDFAPTHKLVVCTNHRPRVRGSDLGIWRRIQLVPFTVTIPEPERDATLPEKLRAEAAGILRWAVDGCMAWQRDGMSPPAAVRAATDEYRLDEDVVGQFIEDRCYVQPGSDTVRERASALFEAYTKWCEETGNVPVRQREFGRAMTERGFGRTKDGRGAKVYLGVRLLLTGDRATGDPDPETGVL